MMCMTKLKYALKLCWVYLTDEGYELSLVKKPPHIEAELLGERVTRLRHSARYSRSKLAILCSAKESDIVGCETGSSYTRHFLLVKIAGVFQVPLKYLTECPRERVRR